MKVERCARCGHTSGGCVRCGQRHAFLGGRIEDRHYCHTFSEGDDPTCYTAALRELGHAPRRARR